MKIGIVGGGTSGLLSALALEKMGHDITVIEKNKIGGLCRSEYVQGYTVDIGVHAITMLNDGPLINLLKRYARYIPNFKPYGDYYIRLDKLYNIPVSMQEWTTTSIIPNRDKVLIISRMIDLITSGFSKDTSVYQVIEDMNLSEISLKFLNTICYFLSGEDMRKTPLWRLFTGAGYIPEDDILPFIYYEDLKINPLKTVLFKRINRERIKKILKEGFLHSIKSGSKKYLNKFIKKSRYWTQGYPLGGIQSICNSILYSLDRTEIVQGEEVVEIAQYREREENPGYILYTQDNSYYCDVVVYSAPSRYLPDITDLPEIQERRDRLKGIKFTKSLTVWIGYHENPLPYLGSEIWIDHPCWATCVTNYDKSLAPPGKHLLGFSFVNTKREEALSVIQEKLSIDIDRTHMLHFQECIPEQASCVVGQYFLYPKIREDFYVVGTDADPRSMGITRAAYSVQVMLSEFERSQKNKD